MRIHIDSFDCHSWNPKYNAHFYLVEMVYFTDWNSKIVFLMDQFESELDLNSNYVKCILTNGNNFCQKVWTDFLLKCREKFHTNCEKVKIIIEYRNLRIILGPLHTSKTL